MHFVHPQIRIRDALPTLLALIKPIDGEKLQAKLSAYFPEKQFIFTDMGRTAFRAVVEKLNLRNSEMLLPAYICDVFVPILTEYRIKPVFLDIDLNTFQIKPEEIKNKITPRARSILVCHTYGLPFDIDQLRSDLRGRSDLAIIEDCAHAFGAGVGNQGEAAFFSLYKQFPALRGGMLVCPKRWSVNLFKTRFNFRDFISFLNYFYPLAFVFKKFGSEIAPRILRKEKLAQGLGEINRASLALFSDFLEDFEKSLQRRREVALVFQKALREMGFSVQEPKDNVFCYLSALVPENMTEKRDEIVQELKKYRVFCTRIWHTPIILNRDTRKKYQINLNEFPNTLIAAKRVINFPLQNHSKEKDIKKIIAALGKVLRKL